MSKQYTIYGFLDIEKEEYPFRFDTKRFELELYPSTSEKWKENVNSDWMSLSEKFTTDIKKHEWIKSKKYDGITSKGQRICFLVSENPAKYNGFRKYKVKWAIVGNGEKRLDNIDGIRLTGGDINYFYPAAMVFKQDFEMDNNSTFSMQVKANKSKKIECGKYRCVKGVDTNVYIYPQSTMNFGKSERPIYAKSSIELEYSKGVSLDEVMATVLDLNLFFKYTFYRTNIHFEKIEICWNEEDKKYWGGRILMPIEGKEEDHSKRQDRVIKFIFWKNNISKMLTVIKNRKIGFAHLCESIESTTHYPTSRFIMVLSEFEREYRNVYGNDSLRSTKYKETKQEVIEYLEKLSMKKTGKKKKYINGFIKGIKNSDDSYEGKVKNALIDCKPIMEYFVSKNYNGTYYNNVNLISTRIAAIRNGIAHSKLSFKINAINMADIKIIEELIYAMRLRQFQEDDTKVALAIDGLFGENVGIMVEE